MDDSIFKNDGHIDSMNKMIRWHIYSDPFAEYIIAINIKSLKATVTSNDYEICAHIHELISEPDKFFTDRYPDGKLVSFLNRVRILAEYEFAMNNWKDFIKP